MTVNEYWPDEYILNAVRAYPEEKIKMSVVDPQEFKRLIENDIAKDMVDAALKHNKINFEQTYRQEANGSMVVIKAQTAMLSLDELNGLYKHISDLKRENRALRSAINGG